MLSDGVIEFGGCLRRWQVLIFLIVIYGDLYNTTHHSLPLLDRVDLVFVFIVGGWAEDCLDLELLSKFRLVHALASHDTAGLVIGVPILYHVRALMNAAVPIHLEVDDEKEH